mgnify:FL=1
MNNITQSKLIIYSSIFFTLFYNYSFFTNTLKVYPLDENLGFVISITFVMTAFLIILLTLVTNKFIIKPILIFVFLVSSLTNYFMNSYHAVIDDSMLRNMMQTDISESLDLLNFKLVLYFISLGLLPSYYIYRVSFPTRTLKQELKTKAKVLGISLLIVLISFFSFSKYYTSFAREHKPLRYSINPTFWFYSVGKYINLTYNTAPLVVEPIGLDAKVRVSDNNRTKIVILVVGEAARADHFSLNGYEKETNPLLKQEDIINFPDMYSCGTSTAESVPCMFAKYNRSDYSYKKGIRTQNVLDVLDHTGDVSVLWRDNNSDSKGVALRVPFENYKDSTNNTICTEDECRDIGMLVGLDTYIETNKGKNIFIVLHQMGNHGPAYYKRYTKEFEKFTPVCKTNQLEKCTQEEISNAYDNAILYTDTFLVKTIDFLKQYDTSHDTAMIYMSDHGESLGEGGVYLHGIPYFMAPDAQTHIGSFMWFGEGMKRVVNTQLIKENSNKIYSQDNLFYTLLGIFNVETKVYDKTMDIIQYESH